MLVASVPGLSGGAWRTTCGTARAVLAVAFAALTLIALTAQAAFAEPSAPPVTAVPAPAPTKSPSERAVAALATHCASCHQAGSVPAGRTADRFANILQLDELARDPALITPKAPDQSAIYQKFLSRHRPLAVFADKQPSPDETEAIRDWIDTLTSVACTRPITPHQSLAPLLDAWRTGPGRNGAVFISLQAQEETCEPPTAIAAMRSTVETLLASLTPGTTPPHVDTLGDTNAILAVSLAGSGLSADTWQRLTKDAPRTAGDLIPADWLAAELLAAKDVALAPDVREAAARLAWHWTRAVDLRRAASELGLAPRDLSTRLLAITELEFEISARRLHQSTLPRPEWLRLGAYLSGAPVPPRSSALPPNTTLDLALITEKPTLRVGDLLTLKVSASQACHLTLINVDRRGEARVLFPNELEPDNLIPPGVAVPIPSPMAGYQVRINEPGREDFVAVCQRTRRTMDGLSFDFEHQRFTILGSWREFLRTAAAKAADGTRAEPASDPRKSRRRSRRQPVAASAPAAIDPGGLDVEGRAAISVVAE